jgi:uncharacterized membrane protein YfcA
MRSGIGVTILALLLSLGGCALTDGQRAALQGAAAGALLGAGGGAIIASSQTGSNYRYALGAGAGAAAGALVGALIGYYYLAQHPEAPPSSHPPAKDK